MLAPPEVLQRLRSSSARPDLNTKGVTHGHPLACVANFPGLRNAATWAHAESAQHPSAAHHARAVAEPETGGCLELRLDAAAGELGQRISLRLSQRARLDRRIEFRRMRGHGRVNNSLQRNILLGREFRYCLAGHAGVPEFLRSDPESAGD